MKKLISRVLILLLVLVMLAGTILPLFALTDEEFEARRDELQNVTCRTIESYRANQQLCDDFRDWLERDIENSRKELENLKQEIANNNADLTKAMADLNTMHQQAEIAQQEIASIESSITVKEGEIAELEVKIQEHIESINQREAQVKRYIASMQTTMRVNDYIEFVMGAQDFAEMMRRTEGYNSIQSYNEEIIKELNEEKLVLEDEQESLRIAKVQLEEDRGRAEEKRALALEQQAVINVYIETIRVRNAQAAEYMDLMEDKSAVNQAVINSLGQYTPPATSSFGRAVQGTFKITAGLWYYPWGSPHFGLDFAASVGTPLLSIGNGVVVSSRGGCPTWGSYPGNCNGGWGNYVTTMINVNGRIYGVLMAHMQLGSITVSSGDIVTMGTTIGKMGSSGSSTGPHMHLEIYYLGSDSIEAAINRWDGTITFGTGSAGSGSWGTRCVATGGVAPCRENPQEIYGYSVGGSY